MLHGKKVTLCLIYQVLYDYILHNSTKIATLKQPHGFVKLQSFPWSVFRLSDTNGMALHKNCFLHQFFGTIIDTMGEFWA